MADIKIEIDATRLKYRDFRLIASLESGKARMDDVLALFDRCVVGGAAVLDDLPMVGVFEALGKAFRDALANVSNPEDEAKKVLISG
jgi:hypothetical protein